MTPGSFELGPRNAPRTKESVETSITEQKEALSSELFKKELEKAALAAQSPKEMQKQIDNNANEFLKHMQVTGKELSAGMAKNRWATRMSRAYAKNTDAKDTPAILREIVAKLSLPVPLVANKTGNPHPYIHLESKTIPGPHKAVLNQCHLTHALYQDINFVKEQLAIENISEEKRVVLLELLSVLETYAENDIGLKVKEAVIKGQKESTTTRGLNEMARATVFLGLSTAGVVLSGAVVANAIVKRKFNARDWLVPAGYGLAAYAVAFPSIFNGRYATAVDQMNKSIVKIEFKKQAKKITGKPARAVSVTAINHDSRFKKIAEGTATEEDKEMYLASLPLNKQDRDIARKFIEDQEAVAVFNSHLGILTDKDAQDIALDLVEWGNPMFEEKLKQNAKRAREAGDETQIA